MRKFEVVYLDRGGQLKVEVFEGDRIKFKNAWLIISKDVIIDDDVPLQVLVIALVRASVYEVREIG